MNRRPRRGFTLVEMLVAIGILSVVAILAWRAISSLLETRARLEPAAEDLRALVAAVGQLDIDLAQAPARPALFAMPGASVRVISTDGEQRLRITRLAESPDGSGTDAVQDVQYEVVEGALVREHSVPGRLAAGPAPLLTARDILLPGVARLRLRVWQASIGWIEATEGERPVDTAVEVRIVRGDGAEVRRVIGVGP